MSSNEIKEDLVGWFGGKESDWKRLSKKKKGDYEIRVFENKILNLTKTIVSYEDDYHNPDYFPINGEFWIYVNKEGLDPTEVDESQSYFDPAIVTDSWEYDVYDKGSVSTMVVLKAPEGNYWYDQHTSFLIENFFGVKDFTSNFDESSENDNVLMKDIPVGEIRKMCEDSGMKFLGYRNLLIEEE